MGFEIDTDPLGAPLDEILEDISTEFRDRTDKAMQAGANDMARRAGGVFSAEFAPGERRHRIGGYHNARIIIRRLGKAPKSSYYRDPGVAALLFREFGTSKQPARPVIRPALATAVENF